MQYRTLRGTGISVSNLAFGTRGHGAETEEAYVFTILDAFVEANGNLVDAVNVYGAGGSEEVPGRGFANRPSDVPSESFWRRNAALALVPTRPSRAPLVATSPARSMPHCVVPGWETV